MAGLLAADDVAVLAHILRHIFIAHGGLFIADAQLIQCLIQAHVGHDGSHHLGAIQPVLLLHELGADIHDVVAVDDIALLVHRQAAIRVAIKGEAHVQAVFHHELLQLADMGGAAVHVDVQAVGPVGNHIGIGPQGVKHALGHLPGAAVGAVQADLEVFIGPGGQGDQVADVAVAAGRIVHGAADGVPLGVGQGFVRVQIGLDALQQALLHFLPVAVDELDPVVMIGVVAGGDHDAAVKVVRTGDVGHAGGAGHMQQISVRPGGGEAGAEGRLIHVAGATGVLADDHLGFVILAIVPAQVAADLEGMVHGQVLIGFPAEAVSSEIFTQ